MSGEDPQAHRFGDDVAAYALGALDPGEAAAFRAHLETCVVCREELATFQQVVDVLPMSAPQHRASRRLRRHVIATARAEANAPVHGGRPWPSTLLGRASVPRAALAFGAAVALVAIVLAGVQLTSSSTNKAHIYRAQVIGSAGSAEVTVSAGHAQLIVHRMPAPPAGKIYEVWLVRGTTAPAPTSALFGVTANGDGDVDVPGNLKGITEVLVTPEPAGGSQTPTHAPVIRAVLS